MLQSPSLFKHALDALPDGVLLTDASRTIIYSNRAFAALWNIPPAVRASTDELHLLHLVREQLTDPDGFFQSVERLTGSLESSDDEILFNDGRVISRRSVPFQEDGEVQARIWIFCDVTEARHANTDALTGLPNRRAYSRQFPVFVQAPDDGFVRAVGMMDVDNFKAYNDLYGHAAGDDALRTIGTILRASLKAADDLVFRIGGEEFLIACRGRTFAEACSFFETIRHGVEKAAIQHRANPLSGVVTASLGLHVFRGPQSPAKVFETVDAALYRSKADGRNRVTQM